MASSWRLVSTAPLAWDAMAMRFSSRATTFWIKLTPKGPTIKWSLGQVKSEDLYILYKKSAPVWGICHLCLLDLGAYLQSATANLAQRQPRKETEWRAKRFQRPKRWARRPPPPSRAAARRA